jgi:hypothetical protein
MNDGPRRSTARLAAISATHHSRSLSYDFRSPLRFSAIRHFYITLTSTLSPSASSFDVFLFHTSLLLSSPRQIKDATISKPLAKAIANANKNKKNKNKQGGGGAISFSAVQAAVKAKQQQAKAKAFAAKRGQGNGQGKPAQGGKPGGFSVGAPLPSLKITIAGSGAPAAPLGGGGGGGNRGPRPNFGGNNGNNNVRRRGFQPRKQGGGRR